MAVESSYSTFVDKMKDSGKSPATSVLGKLITTAIAITHISIGSVHLKDCQAQYLIPYFLIISGVAALVMLILSILPCSDGGEPPQKPMVINVFNGILGLFNLVFFFAGNVWVYSIYAPDYTDTTSSQYCDRVLYLYAFWVITLVYIVIGVTLLASCCMLICICATKSSDPSEPR